MKTRIYDHAYRSLLLTEGAHYKQGYQEPESGKAINQETRNSKNDVKKLDHCVILFSKFKPTPELHVC